MNPRHVDCSPRSVMLRPFLGSLLLVAFATSAGGQAVPLPIAPEVLARHALAQQVLVPQVVQAGEPRPFTTWSNSALSIRDSLVTLARAQVGRRYVRGGQSPDRGFDCSGLVRYVMAALQVSLPRTAAQQAVSGVAVKRETARLRPGDLLTFGKGKRGVSHVGIYVGNGRFVHASSVAGRVIESDVERPRSPLIKPWKGVRRVVASDADSTGQRGGA